VDRIHPQPATPSPRAQDDDNAPAIPKIPGPRKPSAYPTAPLGPVATRLLARLEKALGTPAAGR